MAYSSSIKGAQTIKLCELCNEDNIKWRCKDCDRCFCQKCKTIHLNIPETAKHQTVTFATPIQEVQKKVITDNIPCKNHETKMNCLFCETCDCLVCLECVSISHTRHQFRTIEKVVDDKLEQLKGIKAKVSDNLKTCDSKLREIQNLMPKYSANFDESVTKIKQKEQELKDAISKFSKLLQDKVEVERSKVNIIITKTQEDIVKARKELGDLQEKLETAFASNQGQFIIETTVTKPVLKFEPVPQEVEYFFPETNTERQIQELFGSFKTMMIPPIQRELGVEVLRTFITDLADIHQVIPLDETSAWIRCYESKAVSKSVMRTVTIQNNKIMISKEITFKNNNMTLTPDNGILLTTAGESDVQLMTKTGEIKSILTVAPLFPIGIHVTSDNKVILGVQEPGATYTPYYNSQGAVLVYDKDGNQIHKFQNDRNGKRLFTYPFQITTNNNQDILVIDRISVKTGKTVALDREVKLKWIYKGHSKINVTKKFDPYGITTTSAGYIIVSDYSRNAFHVLSEDGDVLTCKVDINDMGISCPWALGVDREGKLWVGCGTGGDHSGAKLHVVKLLI